MCDLPRSIGNSRISRLSRRRSTVCSPPCTAILRRRDEHRAMIGTLVNTVAILVGGTCGCLFKKALPAWLGEAIMKALGLCVLYLGITGIL
ncbi:MAG: DUF554 family protein, partial [Clostridia bacterium]|nr:DUF554 family protein [Clostridia bacterium]